MEEKRNYVVYTSNGYDEAERVVKMTEAQAKAISWFIDYYDIDGCIGLAEDYEGEEI